MKRMTYFVMALALVLGLTQCKKEQPAAQNEIEGVHITLSVNGGASTNPTNNGSRVDVDPTGHTNPDYATVSFETGDEIYVGYKGEYVGTLTYSGSYFSGDVTIASLDNPEPLYFYLLGGKGFSPSEVVDNTASVVISDQSSTYPVISYAASRENYSGAAPYTAMLENKISIMKFTTNIRPVDSRGAFCIKGLKNKVTVDFATKTFTYDQDGDGLIKMPAVDQNGATWAIVLPQSALSAGGDGTAYTADDKYTGSRPAIANITENQYLNEGVNVALENTAKGSPLTFVAVEACTLEISYSGANISTKFNDNNWSETSGGTSKQVTLQAGDRYSVRAGNSGNTYWSNGSTRRYFTITGGQCKVYGNVMCLLDQSNYTNKTDLPGTYTFAELFKNCGEYLVNDQEKAIYLPATSLVEGCYNQMFSGCSNMTAAPELPATTMKKNCYKEMFEGCSSLTTAPSLSATTLAESCYHSMFMDCSSLTTAPSLSVTTLANSCYHSMFKGCSSLTSAPELSATTMVEECYRNMFWGCTSLTLAPALPATTLAGYCYDSMLKGCTALTSAPALLVTTLAEFCYSSMLEGCTSLTTAPELPATTLAWNCYRKMFKDCTALTTAPELPATTLANSCYYHTFEGCTSLTTAPILPAATLTTDCYNSMFSGCASLSTVRCVATSGIDGNTTDWLSGVAGSGTLYVAAGYTDSWTTNSTSGVPSGWTAQAVEVVNGLFTVNSSGRTVLFSKGNLQYDTNNGGWRFADHQYDRFGTDQSNNHRDLFGWGTGDDPNKTSTSVSDYSTYSEWGNNTIYNNEPGLSWRTLTKDEWVYLFNTRSTTSGHRYAKAMVNNVGGVILLPDNWNDATYSLSNYNNSSDHFSNKISADNWNTLEQAGCVFLPLTGKRDGTTTQSNSVDAYGYYWSSTKSGNDGAYRVRIYQSDITPQEWSKRFYGVAVRLVRYSDSK